MNRINSIKVMIVGLALMLLGIYIHIEDSFNVFLNGAILVFVGLAAVLLGAVWSRVFDGKEDRRSS